VDSFIPQISDPTGHMAKENCVPCGTCNEMKNDRSVDEFAKQILRIVAHLNLGA
jgi:hypothetical protein